MTDQKTAIDLKAVFESGVRYEDWDKGDKAEIFETNYADVLLSMSDREYLRGVEVRVPILAICEPWCGDVQRQLPILARMRAENELLDVRIVNRDEHLDVMERYLTNGALGIPVFVFFNPDFVEVGNWKARPLVCRQIISRAKAAGELDEGKKAVAEIMDSTRNRLTVEEIKVLIDRAISTPEAWRLYYEDAKNRLTPNASEEICNPKTYEKVVDVFHCDDNIQVLLIQDALEQAGVHFFIQMFQDRVWDRVLSMDKGVAVVQVLEEDVERAAEIIEEVLMGGEDLE